MVSATDLFLMTSQRSPAQKLEAPPIIEVMCGFFFPPIPALDPVAVGGWWHEIKSEYPKHTIQPAVIDAPGFLVAHGGGFMRSWLISEDDSWVVQVQPDRFYVNWRRRSEHGYPRFSGAGGVGERAMRELTRFQQYCSTQLNVSLTPTIVELAKVDLVAEGTHWHGVEDLGHVLPLVADLRKVAKSPHLELGVGFSEPRASGRMNVTMSLSLETMPDQTWARAMKIETRTTTSVAASDVEHIGAAFRTLNDDLNDVFFGLISADELERFRKPPGTP